MPVTLGVPESVAGVPLARRLAWAVALRVVLLVVALGVVAIVNFRRGFDVGSETIQYAIATMAGAFALAAAYAAVLRAGRWLEWLVFAQVVLDQAAFTVLVYLTGGASSGATSFYGLTCLLGAFLIGLRGAAVAAVAGISFYGVLVWALQTGQILPPADQPRTAYLVTSEELTAHVVLNVLVIVVVTLLAGYLAERLASAGGRIVEAEARAETAERLAELGRLATGLAHEIRNPLGSIAGSIQLLRTSRGLSEEDRKLCEIIQREASRLNDLVSDMMDVARPKRPEFAVVDAASTAREVVALAGKSGRGVSDVDIAFSGADAVYVRADPSQLRQLVWNLVRNAVQASSAGGKVSVGVEDVAGTVVLTVADRGVGIDAEARSHLFDAFFTTRSHGTGIGLAVVKRIADEHGFAIDVESESGQGATFRVRMGPRAFLPEGAAPAEAPKSSVPPPP
ncbi:MAG TPA: HAMP domain-containing sensor histidine kinase [Polyangiaceae bacterium]|nr:HAMP domain-containing sensor histidine kinase [Polyangiaceae bacterium]